MSGTLLVKMVDETKVEEPITEEAFFGFDFMMHNLVPMDRGEFWGNILAYDYDPKVETEEEYQVMILIKTFNNEEIPSPDDLLRLTNIQTFQDFFKTKYPKREGVPDSINQNMLYFYSTQADDSKLFVFCTYPSEQFLKGMSKAVELHKLNRINETRIIDTSDQQAWKHLQFQF